jgi:hypothetical protein
VFGQKENKCALVSMLKVKLSPVLNQVPRHEDILCLTKYHFIKTYGGLQIQFYALTSALQGAEWSASRLDCFTPRGKSPLYQLDMRLDGPQSLCVSKVNFQTTEL